MFFLLFLPLLVSCRTLLPSSDENEDAIRIIRVDILANYDANQNSTVPIDLVFVQDPSLLAELQSMTAGEWFSYKIEQQQKVEEHSFLLSLDIAPGNNRSLTEFPDSKNKALALVVFADYQTPGVHRKVVERKESVHIRLQEEDFVVLTE